MSKNKPSTKETLESPVHCKKTCKLWRLPVILAIGIGVFYYSEVFIKKSINSAVNKTLGEVEKKILRLEQDISNLYEQMKSLPVLESQKEYVYDCSKQKEKWKTWRALYEKIDADEPFEEELNKFSELFANDHELLDIIKNLAGRANVEDNKSQNKFSGTWRNILRKVIKFDKISQKELEEISGYVLLSCCDNREY
ncbi:MAG: hypothetical protein LBB25_00080 [Holosporaceae bacterium]|jgi:hypothetical protein|nr:hypothetical protein [Holosporaceae bacterium]